MCSMRFIPWSTTHNVRELSGFFKDLRGTCLTKRFIALSLPGADTSDAGSISKRCRNIERSSLDGSVLESHSELQLNEKNREPRHINHLLKVHLHRCSRVNSGRV